MYSNVFHQGMDLSRGEISMLLQKSRDNLIESPFVFHCQVWMLYKLKGTRRLGDEFTKEIRLNSLENVPSERQGTIEIPNRDRICNWRSFVRLY